MKNPKFPLKIQRKYSENYYCRMCPIKAYQKVMQTNCDKKVNSPQNSACSKLKAYSSPDFFLLTFRRSEHGADDMSYSVVFSFISFSHPSLLMKINADIYWKLGPGPPNVRLCGHFLTFTVHGVCP